MKVLALHFAEEEALELLYFGDLLLTLKSSFIKNKSIY